MLYTNYIWAQCQRFLTYTSNNELRVALLHFTLYIIYNVEMAMNSDNYIIHCRTHKIYILLRVPHQCT